MAILDDLHIVSKPERLGTWHSVAQRELWAHCRIQVHWGKTHVWNRAGQNQRRATGCREWQKFMTPQLGCGADQRCLLPNRMSRFSAATVLVELPTVPDVQSAWVLLLHCASSSEWWDQSWSIRSLKFMIRGCGDVCVPLWVFLQRPATG